MVLKSWKRLRYWHRLFKMRDSRYRHLFQTVYKQKCCKILEVGTYRGSHAAKMIETAKCFFAPDNINYWGFDLFEKLTEQDIEKEFSKRPPTCDQVKKRLELTGAKIELYIGYTQETLPGFLAEMKGIIDIDLIFIDGGHSIETITSDWNYCKQMMSAKTIVLFDDYYPSAELGVEGMGCQTLIDSLDHSRYQVEILEPEQIVQSVYGEMGIKMVKVQLTDSAFP